MAHIDAAIIGAYHPPQEHVDPFGIAAFGRIGYVFLRAAFVIGFKRTLLEQRDAFNSREREWFTAWCG